MAKNSAGCDIRAVFSGNLKFYRQKQRLSQLALSIKAELAHNFVNDIENGKKWVSPETISKLAAALDVEPYRFFLTNPLDGKHTRRLHVYLDELNERFSQAVGEIRESYLWNREKG
ncbi:MAG: helix-turn-helix domain-containing protein [Treponema sp.]|jgi:transcriptional regulator with XRE-family HTH domain|nr:helix-turn-helix domain-containing protein [Treponema sp.]